MRKQLVSIVAALLFANSSAFAQPLAPPIAPLPPQPVDFGVPSAAGGVPVIVQVPEPLPPGPVRFWLGAELLEWWVKGAPLPVSLTANSATELLHSDMHFGAFSGAGITFGAWLDDNSNIGLEMKFIVLERLRRTNFTSSDGNGNPALALPFNSVTPGNTGEFVLQVSTPGQTSGNVLTRSTLDLWGTEFNSVWCLLRTDRLE